MPEIVRVQETAALAAPVEEGPFATTQLIPSTPDPAPESEAPDPELDYGSMEALARVELRASVDWKNASLNAKAYSEILSLQYEKDTEADA